MSKKRTRSIIDGGPVTHKRTTPDGKTVITVTLKAINPFMAKVADLATLTSTGIFTLGAFTGAVLVEDATLATRLLIAALPLPAYFMFKGGFHHILARSKLVTFTSNTVSVRRVLMHHFDRKLGVKFALYPHPKADLEEKRIELRKAKREVRSFTRPIKPYYQNSYRLVLEYMGQPNVIMSIYKHEKAQEIVARLTAVNEIIGRYDGASQGTATTPGQDWSKSAGSLTRGDSRSVS